MAPFWLVLMRLRARLADCRGEFRGFRRAAPGIAFAVTAVALGLVVWKAGGSAAEPQIRTAMKCWRCGRTEHRRLRAGEMIPGTCAGCGRTSVAPAYPCPKCRNLVVLNEYRNGKPPTRCEKCGWEVRHGD